jgi:cation:H+ antiporter
MLLAIVATVVGLAILAWSADRFVLGAAAVARYLGMAPLLVGMLVIGFGTSAPEIVVSLLAAAGGNPEIALGNALGSNAANIGLILGVTAIALPIAVHRGILRKEMPVLILATALLWFLLLDGDLSFTDSVVLIVALVVVVVAGILAAKRAKDDPLGVDVDADVASHALSKRVAWFWLVAGLVILIASSRLLVWGAVGIAERAGWSDLVIGLTVVAVGTSAPELAASLAAARKGENDLALGNIIGSNLFNTLAVVGLAGLVAPAAVDPSVLSRDLPVVAVLTVALVIFAFRPGRSGRINRIEGSVLLVAWLAYTAFLLATAG